MSQYSVRGGVGAEKFREATGSAPTFSAIDGVGEKTARAVRAVRGIGAPVDTADMTADELAREAGISQSRARKVIRGGGGNPDIDESPQTGSVEAGNIADAMDDSRRQAGEVVDRGRELFANVVEAANEIPDRRQRRRGDFGAFDDRDPEEVRELGRAATTLRDATADPIDVTEEQRTYGFDESDREAAGRVSVAAREFLEEEQGIEFDEAGRRIETERPDLDTVERTTGAILGMGRETTRERMLRAAAGGRFLDEPPQPSPDAPGYRSGSTGRFVGYAIDEHDATRSTNTGRITGIDSPQPVPRSELAERYGPADGAESLRDEQVARESNNTADRIFDRGNVFQNTTKTEAVARGVDITPNEGLEPRETAGVTGLSGRERDEFGGDGYTSAGGARRGNVPQGFVDNLASGKPPERALEEQDDFLSIESNEQQAADAGVLDPEPSDPFQIPDGGGLLTDGGGDR